MVSDRRLSRARIASAVLGTDAAVGALVAYPTSTGHLTGRPAALAVGPGAAGTSTTGSSGGTGSSGSSGSSSSSSSSASTAVSGDVVDTQWGPVQVEITVSGGRIVSARAVQQPSGNPRDAEINGYALPVLGQEVVQAQSAAIDSVSGATVTSQGYIASLQSAIDSAHL
jgi:uncharacterized protein with FMN-binding domain